MIDHGSTLCRRVRHPSLGVGLAYRPACLAARARRGMHQPMIKTIAVTVSIAALCGAGLVANAACEAPPPSPESTSVFSPPPRFDPALFVVADPGHDRDVNRNAEYPEGQHFCCSETWNDKHGKHGSDCETIDPGSTKTCRIGGGAILHCSGDWDQNTSGTVTC